MSWLQLLILALIQGLTEFLPISSSAHLILAPQVLGWPEDQGPMIDVMAHFGTLFAVMAYFRKDVGAIITGFFDLVRRKLNPGSVLCLNLIIATPPALLFGLFLHFGGYEDALRSPLIIACTTIIFGIALWLSDIWGKREHTVEDMRWRDAVILGLSQAVALIPGTSRSGITMTAARSLGYTRVEAARFSMLMSLPIIGAGGLFSIMKLASADAAGVSLTDGIIVAVVAFIVAYLSIAFFMKWVSRIGMFPFMVYRLFLGAALLLWVFSNGGG